MIVKLKDITKSFKNNIVLQKINLELKPGKIYGLVGRNGSGKTVLLKIICGIMEADSGEVLFDNENYLKKYGIPKSTRALIENPDMINELTGFENLKLIASIQKIISDKEIYDVLELVGLEGEENKKYKEYSLGMKQKLGIAQVIMEDADLLIFDEPFNGLDDKSTEKMRNLMKELKKKNKIVIISTHIKEDIDNLIDELYRIDAGLLKNEK